MNDPLLQIIVVIIAAVVALVVFFAQLRLFEIAATLKRIEEQMSQFRSELTPSEPPVQKAGE